MSTGHSEGGEHSSAAELSDEEWDRLIDTLKIERSEERRIHLPDQARAELNAIVALARRERSEETTNRRVAAHAHPLLINIAKSSLRLWGDIEAAQSNDAAISALQQFEEDWKGHITGTDEWAVRFDQLPPLLSAIYETFKSGDIFTIKRGPYAEGLDTLVWGAAWVIEKYTGKKITRRKNNPTTDRPIYIPFFQTLYIVSGLSEKHGTKGMNVEKAMERYIKWRRGRGPITADWRDWFEAVEESSRSGGPGK